MGSPIVRRAVASEVPAMAGTLQAAFNGYPWTDWVFPAENRAARLRDSFALYLTASINGLGEVWTTQDHSSVAMWPAPGPVRQGGVDPGAAAMRPRRATRGVGHLHAWQCAAVFPVGIRDDGRGRTG